MTKDEALRWVARRLQDGTARDEIVRELVRSAGMTQRGAELFEEEVRISLDRRRTPHGSLLLVVTLACGVAGAGAWAALDPLHGAGAWRGVVGLAMLFGVAIGLTLRAVARGRGGRRLLLAALTAHVGAIVAGFALETTHAAGYLLVVAVPPSALFAVKLARAVPPRFEPLREPDGTLLWRRVAAGTGHTRR
jgi:hypothetical protein